MQTQKIIPFLDISIILLIVLFLIVSLRKKERKYFIAMNAKYIDIVHWSETRYKSIHTKEKATIINKCNYTLISPSSMKQLIKISIIP